MAANEFQFVAATRHATSLLKTAEPTRLVMDKPPVLSSATTNATMAVKTATVASRIAADRTAATSRAVTRIIELAVGVSQDLLLLKEDRRMPVNASKHKR